MQDSLQNFSGIICDLLTEKIGSHCYLMNNTRNIANYEEEFMQLLITEYTVYDDEVISFEGILWFTSYFQKIQNLNILNLQRIVSDGLVVDFLMKTKDPAGALLQEGQPRNVIQKKFKGLYEIPQSEEEREYLKSVDFTIKKGEKNGKNME